MSRVLVMVLIFGLVLAPLPASLPSSALAATLNVTCDGVNDTTDAINPTVAGATTGDVINISHPAGGTAMLTYPSW